MISNCEINQLFQDPLDIIYILGPQGRDFTSTTRAPPPFNPGFNPVYQGGAGYDPLYPGQRPPTGFNNLPHFNLTRPGHGSGHLGKSIYQCFKVISSSFLGNTVISSI